MEVEELKQLVETSQTLIVTASTIMDTISDPDIDLIGRNMARTLSNFRDSVHTFIKNVSRHKRNMATHIFVMMISCEYRDVKPYAVPVQCLPYHSMTQEQLRQLVSSLVKEMVSRGMKVAGKQLL